MYFMIPPTGRSGKSKENAFQEKYRHSKTIKDCQGFNGEGVGSEGCCQVQGPEFNLGTHMVGE